MRAVAEADPRHADEVDPNWLRGRPISSAEFFGSGYVHGALVLDLEEHYSLLGDELDFTRAFYLPPYGLVQLYGLFRSS